MAYTTLRSGSSGSDVKKLQNALINAGYSVGSSGADGIYGSATAAAVKAYQKANGLSVDGIAGNNTLSKLYGNSSGSTSTKSSINNKWSDIDLSKYEGGFTGNAATDYAESQKNSAESALKNYGSYESKYEDYLKSTLDSILNREDFSYDLNGDALYQQYKDKYMNQGKLAMMDTMGQASAMTGGYGNSYASTAGNQAYQSYLQQLNDVVPELYQLALDKYNQEGADLQNQYNLLSDAESRDYSKWYDQYKMLASDRDYYNSNYFNVYGQESDTFRNNYEMDSSEYWNAYNAGYGAEQDAIANALAEKQYQLDLDKYNESVRQWEAEQDYNYYKLAQEQAQWEAEQAAKAKTKEQTQNKTDTEEIRSSCYTIENILKNNFKNASKEQKIQAIKGWYNDGTLNEKEYAYLYSNLGLN